MPGHPQCQGERSESRVTTPQAPPLTVVLASVDVLLRINAKCVVGQDELAMCRTSEALLRD